MKIILVVARARSPRRHRLHRYCQVRRRLHVGAHHRHPRTSQRIFKSSTKKRSRQRRRRRQIVKAEAQAEARVEAEAAVVAVEMAAVVAVEMAHRRRCIAPILAIDLATTTPTAAADANRRVERFVPVAALDRLVRTLANVDRERTHAIVVRHLRAAETRAIEAGTVANANPTTTSAARAEATTPPTTITVVAERDEETREIMVEHTAAAMAAGTMPTSTAQQRDTQAKTQTPAETSPSPAPAATPPPRIHRRRPAHDAHAVDVTVAAHAMAAAVVLDAAVVVPAAAASSIELADEQSSDNNRR